ncbi:Nova1 [Symbiodinium necroappetens]|uniref:Nova1 protein n=1 Tax=Symbiodinium necroappetens TaxID=1628268 RepID=A0A813BHR6_9DINO|nr:Nova1 [Symbiodinium necroappetens]
MGCGDGGKGMRRLAFKVLCPNELIARIMGKGGARKDQLQSEAGCRIVVSGRDEFFPGTRWRVLLIYSDRSEAILAVMQHVIRDVIECGAKESPNPEADFLGPDRGSYIVRCVVTKQMSSAIIGPKGNNARAIREESGSKVVIDPNITAGHQFVKLVGEPQGLRIALARVNQYVQEQYGSPTYMEWATIKSFDGAGNPIHSGPAETGFSYGSVHGHMGKGGAEWPDERERTPRQGATATPAQWSGSKGVVVPPQPPVSVSGDDPETDLLSALSSTAEGFPAGTLDMEYTITCELPSEKVGLLIGKRGEDVQRIRKTTGTYIHFDPAQDGSDGQTLTIRGPLLKVYRAHALLMRRYHETQAEEAPHNGTSTNGDSDQKVQALEEQLQAMQRQLAEVKQLQQSNTSLGQAAYGDILTSMRAECRSCNCERPRKRQRFKERPMKDEDAHMRLQKGSEARRRNLLSGNRPGQEWSPPLQSLTAPALADAGAQVPPRVFTQTEVQDMSIASLFASVAKSHGLYGYTATPSVRDAPAMEFSERHPVSLVNPCLGSATCNVKGAPVHRLMSLAGQSGVKFFTTPGIGACCCGEPTGKKTQVKQRWSEAIATKVATVVNREKAAGRLGQGAVLERDAGPAAVEGVLALLQLLSVDTGTCGSEMKRGPLRVPVGFTAAPLAEGWLLAQ